MTRQKKNVHRVIKEISQNINNWLIPEGYIGLHCTFFQIFHRFEVFEIKSWGKITINNEKDIRLVF